MALALYRKYRPATFAEVVGQEHVTGPLVNAVDGGRINHAYLFSGPRGCGKTSSARILARSLNCEQGPTSTPCGVCGSCVALAPDGPGSLDVIEIDAASHGGVDDARDLRERAFFAPVHSRYKVYIVDEAHMVSSQGFNALLKVVEEPPEFLVFVFATTEPEKVLPTIRSRTHHYPFRLVPPATLRSLLERTCQAEGVTVEPTVFPLVVRAGGGSARDSLSILDQLLAGAGPEGVTYRTAVGLLGVTDDALLDETLDALAVSDAAGVFRAVDRVVEAGHDPRRFATDLLDRLRDLIVLDAVPDAASGSGLLDGPPDRLDLMSRQAQAMGAATLSRLADTVHEGLTEMRGTTAPRLLLELVCARMLLPATDDGSAATLQRLERLERRMSIAGEHAGRPAVEAAAPAVAVRPTAPAVAARPAAPAEEPGPRPDADAARREYVRPSRASGPTTGSGRPAAAPVAAPAREVPAGASAPAPSAPAPSAPATSAPAAPAAAAEGADGWPATVPPGGPRGGATAASATTAPTTTAPTAPAPARAPGGARPAAPETDGWPETAVPGRAPASPAAAPRPPATAGEPDIPLPPEPTDDEDWPQSGPLPAAAAPTPAAPAPRPVAESSPAPRGGEPTPLVSATAGEAPPGDGELTTADVRRIWPELLGVVKKHKRTTEALLKNFQVHDLTNGALTLSTSSPALARRMGDDLNRDVIREALNELLGVRWKVVGVLDDPNVPGPAGSAPGPGPQPRPSAGRAEVVHEADTAEGTEILAQRAQEDPGEAGAAPVVDAETAALALLRSELGARPLDG